MSTQRGTINQHPRSGSWGFRVTYTDSAGKRQYLVKYKKTWRQKDAQQALTACLVQIDAGHNLANNRGTVGAYLLQWFEQWSADDTLKRSTIDTAKIHLDKYLIPAIGAMTLRELKPAKLSAIYRTMMADGRTHGTAPLSAKTIRNIAGTLHKALADAVENGVLATNPAQYAKTPKYQRPALTTYDDEQVAIFLQHCQQTNQPHIALWCLILLIGLRRGEVLGLTWADVDWLQSEIQVRQTRSVTSTGEQYIDTPKTVAGARYLTVDSFTLDALAHLKNAQEAAAQSLGGWLSDYIATDLDGTPVHPRTIARRFQAISKAAGLPQIRLHDGRHTALSNATDAGVPIHVVSARAGHTRASFTADTYLHRHRTADHRAADLVANRMMDKLAALNSAQKCAHNAHEMRTVPHNQSELDSLSDTESL